MNSAAEARPIKLQLRVFSLAGHSLLDTTIDGVAPASATHEMLHALPALTEPVMAELRALDAADGSELARDCAWAEPFKFHRLGGARIDAQLTDKGLRVEADLPVKGLWLHAPGARFADNFIDLVPGAPRLVAVEGPALTAVHVVALDHAGRVIDLAR
jgi:beta-mannosidase